MLKCPVCGQGFSTALYRGPILFVNGQVTINAEGKVEALGPAVATLTVKSGEEFDSDLISLECPKCKNESPSTAFVPILPSYISTMEGTTKVNTPFGEIAVHHSEVNLAVDIFNEANAELIQFI